MNDALDLSALKDAWRTLDARLARQHALERERFRASRLRRARLQLFPLGFAAVAELGLGLAIALPSASFWFAHRHEPGPLVAGLLLHGYGLLMLAFGVRELVQLARLDFDTPLLALQKELAALHELRVTGSLLLGCSWWFLWFALPLCLARAFAGIDLHARAPGWVLGNLAVGLLGFTVSLLVARRLRRRGHALSSGLLASFLTRARRELEELARFEREE